MCEITEGEAMDLWVESLQGEVAKLKAEVARLKADAVSWEWLRSEALAEADRLRARAVRADLARAKLVAIQDDLGQNARADSRYRLRDVIREAIAGLDAAPAGEGRAT